VTLSPRILICGWAGAGNIGDELLTRSMIDLVNAAGGHPVVASRAPEATSEQHHGVESVRWGPTTAWTGRACDGIIVGPGGIIQDSSSAWSLPGHLTGPLLRRWRGTPVTGIGLGAELLRRRSSRWLLRRTLGDREPIVRDRESATVLSEAGVDAVVAPDIAFTQPLRNVAKESDARQIVVAVGGAVAPGSLLPAARRIAGDDPPLIAAALDVVAERLDAAVAFVSVRGERDTALAEAVVPRMAASTEIITPEIDQTLDAIAGADLLISARYHSSLVAVQNGVPTVVLSEQAKLRSLVAQIGDRDRIRLIDDWEGVVALDQPTRLTPYEPEGLDLVRGRVAAFINQCARSA
jgi:polysaccharide pyruvyl transferase CsaB